MSNDYSLSKREYSLGLSKFVSGAWEDFFPHWKKIKGTGGNQNRFSFRWYLMNHMFNTPVSWGFLCSCPSNSLPEIHPYFYSVNSLLHTAMKLLLFFTTNKDKQG